MSVAEQIGIEPGRSTVNGVDASLELEFRFDPESGRTVLAGSRQEPPLRVVRAFVLQDGSALAHLHNVSGGLLGGDKLQLHVCVGGHAGAQLTTTGATRIYRMREGAPGALQETHISIGENGLLEYVPDPIIPFAGSHFRQKTTIRLASGAGLFWWEMISPGREASDELFAYERMELESELWAPERLLAAEHLRLEPRARQVSALARLGKFRYWATFYICKTASGPNVWAVLEERIRDLTRSLEAGGDVRWGVSALLSDGLIVRGLARHGRCLLPGLMQIWSAAKLLLYGRDAIPPRKVN